MAFIQAIYNGVKYDLDVLEDTPIRVDISAIENSDIGEVFGATSQQFTLPGSKKNNRFFKHAYKVGVTGVPGLGEAVDAAVISKSDTLLEGSLFLDEVVKTPNGGYNYEVTITNNVITFNEAVKTTAIKDLAWDSYDHSFTVANVTGSWTNNLFGGDIYYPLIDQGRDGLEETGSLPNIAIDTEETASVGFINNSSTPIQVQQFTPAVRVSTVLDKIFEQGEFSYSSSIQNLFDNLYILPKQTENLSVKGAGFSDFGFIATKESSGSIQNVARDTNTTIVIDNEVYDPSNAYNDTTYTYTVPRTGTYQFSGSIEYEYGDNPPPIGNQLILRVKDTTNNVSLGSTIVEALLTGSVGVETNQVNLQTGTTVVLELRYNPGTAGSYSMDVITGKHQTLVTPINYETGTIKIGEQFEPQTKCIDVLRGLIQKLNLVIEPVYTQNKVLKIEPFNNWANSGKRVDWTRKIQNADRISLRSTLATQQKTLKYEDNKDNDKLSKQVQDNAEGFQWGTEVVDAVSNVPQGERKIGAYFAPVILDRIPGGDSTNLVPQLYKTDNTEIGKKTFKFKPRLGYKITGSLSQTAFIGNNTGSFTDYATISNYDSLPVVSGSTNNLHFNETFYAPAFDSSATGSITSYKTYWDSYVEDLYDADSKILKAQIKFEPDEIANIELNDKIFVEDKWYRINKIGGYNLNYTDVVDLELITVNITGFPPIVCDFQFDLVTTTTTTTTTTTSTTTTTTTTTTAAPAFPAGGNLFKIEAQVSGSENIVGGQPYFGASLAGGDLPGVPETGSFTLITDSTLNTSSNNVLEVATAGIINLNVTSSLGTVALVYRILPDDVLTGSVFVEQSGAPGYFLDARSGPNPNADSGPLLYFSTRDGIPTTYNSGSYYASNGSGGLTEITMDVNNTGSFFGNDSWIKTRGTASPLETGSVISGSTGMDTYKMLVISPDTLPVTASGTFDSWSLSVFTNDASLPPQQAGNIYLYQSGSSSTPVKFGIASLYGWNTVLTDSQVQGLNSYVINTLGYNL